MTKQTFKQSLTKAYHLIVIPKSLIDTPFENVYNMRAWNEEGDSVLNKFNSIQDLNNIFGNQFTINDFNNTHIIQRIPMFLNTGCVNEVTNFLKIKGLVNGAKNINSLKSLDPNQLQENEFIIGDIDEIGEYASRLNTKDIL